MTLVFKNRHPLAGYLEPKINYMNTGGRDVKYIKKI